ncbi:hypothetical protein FOXB_16858 [Fusarium oxysporum f. sp. conglutinans Fo5176]|uniref:Uncharacterized protein n=1 Tax=Fusarium oxysporum (strain Fo5176) TaxID=660025 RepID=F9GDX4_FUSOF|nr:hypothetical protein FOXB_16858 [Fusarium oxysporum f. sp. conglutinans Fo5176]
MYFDGQDFPAKSAVGWVSARDLRQFDANNKNSLVPHIRSVRKFLKTRAEKRSPEREVDGSKSEAPDATEQSSIEANSYPPTPLKVPLQHRSPQMAAPDQDQEGPSSLPTTQPVLPLDHVALHDPPIQQQSLPDPRSDEGQQHRLNLEDIPTSSHGPGRQLDEPCDIFEPISTAALSNTTQEVCQDAGLLGPHGNERANRTATPEKNMGAGLVGFSVSEPASGVAICPPHPPSRGLLPMNLMSNPLKTPEIYATEPFPSSPFIPHASPTDSAQPALLYALEQHAQVEMGRPRSNRPIIDAANSTAEERQQAQQAPSVVQSSNDASDAVGGMPCNADQPRLSQIRAPYNFETSRTTIVLPPISSMLKQGVNSPPSHEPPGQTPTLNNQPSSFPAHSPQLAINAPLPPSLSPSLCTRPLTTKLASKSPDVRASFNQISTVQYAPALPTQVQSDDSFHTRGSSASIATEQRHLNSPGAPTSDLHDGCNALASCELEVTRPKGDWYKKLPEDLIACLEKYQQDNNLSLGIDGLRIQPGNYMIQERFGKLENDYTKTDPMAVRHLNQAYNCLIDCLGDPLCDMMLLLALTFGACTVTPHIDERGSEFYPARKRKESDILAATMVIRMLWFMRKEAFLWEDTDERVLSVARMTEETENRAFNNHGLLKFGWVEYKTNTGNRRRTPQTTELQLRSMEELYEDCKCLISAMKNAERFISLVFGSDDEVWVARCYSIIRDRRLACTD